MEKSLKADSNADEFSKDSSNNNNNNVHILPCQDPTSKCRIEQAGRIIQCMNQKRFAIFDQIELLKLDRENIIRKLKDLKYRDRSLRYNAVTHKEKLEPLQLALDKLNFKNNAYCHGDIKSSFSQDQIHLQKLQFRLVHGSNSMGEERRLLKKAKKSQQKGASDAYCPSMEQISYSIMQLNYSTEWISKDETQRRKIVEEMRELKWQRQKAIANAAVKGNIWSSLGSKQTIQDKINTIEGEVEKVRKNQLAVRGKIKILEKNLEAIEKNIISLQKQLTIANQRKGKAYQCIVKLRN